MSVHALVTSIWTNPEPTVFLVLHSFDKVLAHFVGSCSRVSVLAQDDLPQFLFVPLIHRVILLFILCCLRCCSVSAVRVNVLLGGLPLDAQIMAELALVALLAIALLVEHTENGLGVDAERNLLDLHRLEQLRDLLPRLLRRRLLLLTTGLLCLFFLLLGTLVRLCLRLQLGYLFPCNATFFLYRNHVRH